MDTYIELFRSWLYSIAAKSTDTKLYEEYLTNLLPRIDRGELEQFIVQRVQEDLYANGKSEGEEVRA